MIEVFEGARDIPPYARAVANLGGAGNQIPGGIDARSG